MGCCISHPSGPNSPYPGGTGGGSTRAINNVIANSPTSLGPTRSSIAGGLGAGGGHNPLDEPPRTAHTTLLSPSSTSRRICYNTLGNGSGSNSSNNNNNNSNSSNNNNNSNSNNPTTNTTGALDHSPASTLTHASNSYVRDGENADSGGRQSSHRHNRSRRPLSQHINKSLRRHVWAGRDSGTRTDPQRPARQSHMTTQRAREAREAQERGEHAKRRAWTRATLRQERQDFFDTRVTGREEVWQALRAAAETLWEADEQWAARTSGAQGAAGLAGHEHEPTSGRRTRRRGRRRGDEAQARTGGVAEDEGGNTEAEDSDADADADEADVESKDGEPLEEEHSPDPRPAALATAQTILDAADITVPTGDLAHGVYDTLGAFYPLPEYVICDPPSLVDTVSVDSSDESDARSGGVIAALTQERTLQGTPGGNDVDTDEATADEGGDFADDDNDDHDDDDDDDDENSKLRARRREEKGKAVVDMRDMIPLRARLSDGSLDVVVSIGTGDTVRSIAASVADEVKLPPNKRVRIVYLGKMLKGSATLPAQGWRPGRVVNAFVFDR